MALAHFLRGNADRARSRLRLAESIRRRRANVELSAKLSQFYSSNFVSPWQRKGVDVIRKDYEEKLQKLSVAHDIAASKLSDEYMKFELDYLWASREFKKDNPGQEMDGIGRAGVFSGAFWRNMSARFPGLTHGKA